MNRRYLLKRAAIAAAAGGAWSWCFAGTIETPALAPGAIRKAAMTDLDGRPRRLKDWSGRLRLVNFWATWCGPCRAEIPLLEDAQRRYRGRNFTVIGVALDTTSAVSSFKQRLGITYPLLVAGSEYGLEMMKAYGNDSGAVPYSVFLSPNGGILDTHLGAFDEENLHDLLEQYLKSAPEQPPAPEEPETQLTLESFPGPAGSGLDGTA
ncbi:MAG: TlpA disulfide reductase family protein [Arenicellales bacterium]